MDAFSGTTHIAIALILYFFVFGLDITHIAGVVVGSLFPDIDIPYSILGRYNPFSKLMKHRGFTHTLPGMGLFSLIIYFIFDSFVWGFIFGYGLHILADFLTPMGIMWLYPYKKRYYSIWRKKKKTLITRVHIIF